MPDVTNNENASDGNVTEGNDVGKTAPPTNKRKSERTNAPETNAPTDGAARAAPLQLRLAPARHGRFVFCPAGGVALCRLQAEI